MKTVKLYYVDPENREAVCIITKAADIVCNIAHNIGLVKVAKSFFHEYRISHGEKVLVL